MISEIATVLCIVSLASLTLIGLGAVGIARAHRRSRDIPPSRGQIWDQGGELVFVEAVHEDGSVLASTASGACWIEDKDAWAERVRSRVMFLLRERWTDGEDDDRGAAPRFAVDRRRSSATLRSREGV